MSPLFSDNEKSPAKVMGPISRRMMLFLKVTVQDYAWFQVLIMSVVSLRGKKCGSWYRLLPARQKKRVKLKLNSWCCSLKEYLWHNVLAWLFQSSPPAKHWQLRQSMQRIPYAASNKATAALNHIKISITVLSLNLINQMNYPLQATIYTDKYHNFINC